MLKALRDVPDVGYLIFVTDDTKIKGNRAYDQGNYYEALDIYEQVIACYAWLQFKDPSLKDRLFSDPELDTSRFSLEGIIDEDVDFHERRVINEADRPIETETSKGCFWVTMNVRAFHYGQYSPQLHAGLHEYAPFRRCP